ncbi:MAG: T9SS type A sorting domain-containing protein [Chloroflexota bacterium]|nr:T9SS type A sorting domain-containing protein [Chloroflexota bacterium]
MAIAPKAHLRKPPRRSVTLAESARDVRAHALASWHAVVAWWNAQSDNLRVALVVVGLVAAINVVNLASAAIARAGASQAAPPASAVVAPVARSLAAEAAPIVPGKAWVASQLWQGSSARVTESFSVGAHWRVDWLYDPPPSGGIFQVFIYSADGTLLMDVAANTQKSGPDSSFWAGPGTYFLKVNSTGGDWKLDVQDLR